MQGFKGLAKSIVHEEGCSHHGQNDQDRGEEDDIDVDAHGDGLDQIWEN